ncbi:hypothetical protein G159_10720 [Planococcus glaciei CHR43]|nr:hypothetical protein G159_10720 [Planococcus glaciei CHR43]
MALLAIFRKAEATSRGWPPELDNNEKRKRPLSSDRHKTNWRSGAFCRTARMAYDPRSWPLQLDTNEKRTGAV